MYKQLKKKHIYGNNRQKKKGNFFFAKMKILKTATVRMFSVVVCNAIFQFFLFFSVTDDLRLLFGWGDKFEEEEETEDDDSDDDNNNDDDDDDVDFKRANYWWRRKKHYRPFRVFYLIKHTIFCICRYAFFFPPSLNESPWWHIVFCCCCWRWWCWWWWYCFYC